MVFRGPLFIVGAPRSGTKLLRDLVKQHPGIGIPDYETEFLPRWLDRDFDLDRDFEAFYDWATRFMYFKYMADEGRCISLDQWQAASPSPDVRGVFEGLCRHDAGQPEGVWGDKYSRIPPYNMVTPCSKVTPCNKVTPRSKVTPRLPLPAGG